MFTIYDLAEIVACFAAFFTMLFVLVRKPGHLSAHLFLAVASTSCLMWVIYIVIVSQYATLSRWQQGLMVSAFSLSTVMWLLFLLVFAREPALRVFRKRSLTVFTLCGLLMLAAIGAFVFDYVRLAVNDEGVRHFEVSAIGRYFVVLVILSSSFGLLQLESTFRASHGALRKSIRLPIGLTALMLAIVIITGMMAMLVAEIELINIQLTALTMSIAMIAIARFVVFEELEGQRVVVSREAVYSSVALLLVGLYFILIGIVVKLLAAFGGKPEIFLSILAAFVLVVFFLALAFSGSLRRRWRGIVDRSLYSGKADLLAELTNFAEEVTAATDTREMISVMAGILVSKCQMENVTVFLTATKKGEVYQRFPETPSARREAPELEQWLFRCGRLTSTREFLSQGPKLSESEDSFLQSLGESELIPLVARKELVGFIAASAQQTIDENSRFLIDSVSHQFALSLLSARQSEALLETRELASFTKVSSFVIHDVKNLISMLSMILQNAERKSDDPRFQQMTTETIIGAQERMKRLIGRLSSPREKVDFVMSHCDLREIVLNLLEDMRLSSNPKIRIHTELDSAPAAIGNADRIQSVLSNLIINAVEAMPNGGDLRITSASDTSSVEINVCDTGMGMTLEFQRDNLFRPFQTSKAHGLGIGLFQARELVEQMGGTLTVESAPGKGSCFNLKLRRAK